MSTLEIGQTYKITFDGSGVVLHVRMRRAATLYNNNQIAVFTPIDDVHSGMYRNEVILISPRLIDVQLDDHLPFGVNIGLLRNAEKRDDGVIEAGDAEFLDRGSLWEVS